MKQTMKYRIKESNGKFFPQYKSLLTWQYFDDSFGWGHGMLEFEFDYVALYFATLEAAQDFLDDYKNTKKKIIHSYGK